MEAPIPRLTYVLVFACKKCQHDICMPFHAEDPEAEVHVIVSRAERSSALRYGCKGIMPRLQRLRRLRLIELAFV